MSVDDQVALVPVFSDLWNLRNLRIAPALESL
jgi:hypothetical protein